jgi:hypothetical protein
VLGSQLSTVQVSLSSHDFGTKTQFPSAQESVVQTSPSSQIIGVYTQPVEGSQVSVVHESESSHVIGVKAQLPSEHASVVHRLLSLQLIGV